MPIKYNSAIMNKKQQDVTQSAKAQDIKNIFRRMMADRNAVQSYIRKHGTLIGFKNESIFFAKPL